MNRTCPARNSGIVEDVERFSSELSEFMRSKHPDILKAIRETQQLGEDLVPKLEAALDGFVEAFQSGSAAA